MNQKTIKAFLSGNYKVIIFYCLFAVGQFIFFWALLDLVPGGRISPSGFFISLDERRAGQTGTAADKSAIIKNVDTITADINKGKSANDFKAKDFSPTIAIMDDNGRMVVHSEFPGYNVRQYAPYIYNEITKGTADGVWVEFPSKGKLKHVYAKKTNSNLFVTSGYQ